MAAMEIRPSIDLHTAGQNRAGLRLRGLTIALGLLIAPIASAQTAFLAGGQELSSALKQYAQTQGWSLRWKAGEDYFLDVDQVLPGSGVVGDIEHVIRTYQDRGALEGVGIALNKSAKTIDLVKGVGRHIPVTDPAIALRASVMGKGRLGVGSPAALSLAMAKPASPAAQAPRVGAVTTGSVAVASGALPALAAAPAPAPVAPVAAPVQQTFAVLPGDLMSTVLERWTKGSQHNVVWEASSDFRFQAGANFYGKTLMQAVEELASIVSKTQSGLRVDAYRNGVIVVSEVGK